MQARDPQMRRILQEVAVIAEGAQQLIEQVAATAGFYRKRAGELDLGDEIDPYGEGDWRLVVDIEAKATHEGTEIYTVSLDTGSDDIDFEVSFDPQDWLDVKAQPTPEPF